MGHFFEDFVFAFDAEPDFFAVEPDFFASAVFAELFFAAPAFEPPDFVDPDLAVLPRFEDDPLDLAESFAAAALPLFFAPEPDEAAFVAGFFVDFFAVVELFFAEDDFDVPDPESFADAARLLLVFDVEALAFVAPLVFPDVPAFFEAPFFPVFRLGYFSSHSRKNCFTPFTPSRSNASTQPVRNSSASARASASVRFVP